MLFDSLFIHLRNKWHLVYIDGFVNIQITLCMSHQQAFTEHVPCYTTTRRTSEDIQISKSGSIVTPLVLQNFNNLRIHIYSPSLSLCQMAAQLGREEANLIRNSPPLNVTHRSASGMKDLKLLSTYLGFGGFGFLRLRLLCMPKS